MGGGMGREGGGGGGVSGTKTQGSLRSCIN